MRSGWNSAAAVVQAASFCDRRMLNEAYAKYHEVLAHKPENASYALNGLGRVCIEVGLLEEAEECFSSAGPTERDSRQRLEELLTAA